MPVKHDLPEDLGITPETLNTLKAHNPHLTALIQKYAQADKKVLDAEKGDAVATPDAVMTELKSSRLALKDQIVEALKASQKSQTAQEQ